MISALFSSKKFLVMLAGVVLAIANKLGLDLDPELVNQILALVGVYIVGQGIADRGKEAAKVNAELGWKPLEQTLEDRKAGPSVVLMLLLVAMVVSPLFVACGPLKDSARHAGKGVVDCMKPEAKAMIGELAPTFLDVIKNATGNDGKIDRAPLRSAASSLTSELTRCAFAAAVAEVLRPKQKDPDAPQSSELGADPADVLASFDAIRAELYGGPVFQLETGPL